MGQGVAGFYETVNWRFWYSYSDSCNQGPNPRLMCVEK